MNSKQGFSLIEVLVALALTSLILLVLAEQQMNTRNILIQVNTRADEAQFLDQIDELLFLPKPIFPSAKSPYQLRFSQSAKEIRLELGAVNELNSLKRQYLF